MKNIIVAEHISKAFALTHQKTGVNKSFREDIIGLFTHPQKIFISQKKETFLALNNISFTIQEGESVGIIGPNGAGKSTLLKILSRITPPTKGKVTLNGRVSSLLEVGTGFHPELTGRENIFLSGAILGMKRQEIVKKFDQIVDFAEVEKFLDTPVKYFSSGMYTRLAFSVAAHLEPEILIVDEVLAVGDIRFQKKSIGMMENMGKSGRTVLFVSHNMSAIRSFCTRAILLEKGKIIAAGPTSKVIDQYTDSVQKNIMSQKWTVSSKAPQNSSVILKQVDIKNHYGNSLTQITTDDAFSVRVKYTTVKENAYAGFMLIFKDSDNRPIFQTMSNHDKQWGKSLKKGTYVSECFIPKNFFNTGAIAITLVIFDANFSEPVNIEDVLHIDIQDGYNVRKDFYGRFDGTVRPLFTWETKKNE